MPCAAREPGDDARAYSVTISLQFVSIYAAYLYDAVKLYARALDYLIRQQGENVTEAVIEDIASNGTNIIQTIIKNRTYESEQFRRRGSRGNLRLLHPARLIPFQVSPEPR